MTSEFELRYIPVDLNNLGLALKIQKEQWPETPDFKDLYDKAVNTKDDNIEFLVYDGKILIGITGVDVIENYKDTIWLDWFTILPEYRRNGWGRKVLLDTINYCKSLNKFDSFRVETTYYEGRPAVFLYDKVMQLKEYYTLEDKENEKTNTLIYSYTLNGKLELWNNKNLGLKEYYDNCK